MDTATDLFPEEHEEKTSMFWFILIVTLYAVYIFIFGVNYFTVHSPAFVASSPRMLISSLVLLGIPLSATVLFIAKTKAGWLGMVLVNAMMITFIVKAGLYDYYRHFTPPAIPFRTIYAIANALVILVLSFTPSVLRCFKLKRAFIIITILLMASGVTVASLFI